MRNSIWAFAFKSLFVMMTPFVLFFVAGTWNGLVADESFAADITKAHNKYRAELGIPDLKWSDDLAAHAKKWSDHLASLGGKKISHAPADKRKGEGENIWWGTTGYYSFTQMVDGWGDEKKYFVYGTFPDVSSSGNWADVGHYTQIIWKDTTEVGCGLSTAGGYDILVCRYSPPGNYMKRKPY